jgi:hypothetical protein
MTTTWRDIAAARGFTDLGDRTWRAPNGQPVAEGFVEAHCRPERIELEALTLGNGEAEGGEVDTPQVDGRRGDVAVPQELADHVQWRARFEHFTGARVA